MAVAAYTTDLAVITVADATTGFAEPTSATAGGLAALESDYFIQGTNCVSKTFNATGLGGLAYTAGANVTIPTDGAFYTWVYFAAPNALSSKATGGSEIIAGSSGANYKRFYVAGNDTYTYGGWVNYPVNPSVTASATVGTPAGTWATFGYVANIANAISKGNPFAIDAIRYGRGTLQVVSGQAGAYGTFLAAANTNDDIAARWGILSLVDGIYKFQGHLLMGTAATAVDFRDSNKAVSIQNTEFVTSAFNLFEVRNAASNVAWTDIAVTALGTIARGNFLVTDNATVALTGCSFTDMGTFTFLSNTTVSGCTFRRCSTIAQSSSIITNSLITASTATPALTSSNPGNISGTEFVSAGTGHAIQIDTAGSYTFTNNIFTGYSATNGSADAAILNNSGGSVTITITGGNSPAYKNNGGATTSIVSGATVTFTGLPTGVDIVILTAGTTTILQQVDQNSGTSYAWGYSGTPTVDVGFIKTGYVPYYIRNLALGSSNSSIPVAMTIDRNYI